MRVNKFRKYLFEPDYRFLVNSSFTHIYDNMSNLSYVSRKYNATMKMDLNIDNPVRFNEKLQWLKSYDRRPEYTIMSDKHLVKDYVSEKIGEKYIIPTIGVWDDPDEIDFDALPDKFVLKCNHNSGLGMCICKDKKNLDIKKVKKGLRKGLVQDYYLTNREWPYKDIVRKVIAEQYMEDESGGLIDYKVHCFNGEPKFILVCKDRFAEGGMTEDFYSTEWEHLELKRPNCRNAESIIEKPKELDEILELSKILSKDIPFVRTDFYIITHKVYFSEMTFFPAAGFEKFEPDKWDYTFGSWLELPDIK